ncbi:preprotein translocase subunit YajC [Janibacter limosus]|jgi:preprotein translocase subunit YajC|uniref:Preprotein translocase subunit YajC n=1 Tax=Janibacter limosus TaxID=53458 RepID=A0AC61U0N1_9MICO|nr:preprotein translocase subunit YajC [Janibacter limosus]UUZ43569.1 preprotein translocase subunit YajC [Janibacter limosus]
MNQGSQTASLLLLLLPLVLIGFMLWSARRRQRTMAEFSASLQVGDEVFTTSGILGRIIELDDDRARLEVAPGTVLTFDRRAIGMKVEGPAAASTTEQGGQD